MSPATFFRLAAPLLEGRAGLEVLTTTRLSRRDTDGLVFYQRLMHANVVHTLEALFPLVSVLLGPRFDAVCRDWASVHPSAHWDLNHWATGFADFIASRFPDEAALSEAADLHSIELDCARPVEAFEPGRLDNRTATTRQYTHRVDLAVRAVRSGPPSAVAPAPVVLIVFRSQSTGLVHHHLPDLAELLAFGLVRGEASLADAEAVGLSSPALSSGAQRLVHVGLLSAMPTGAPWAA
ncbi:MAG: putative DNA-binding domain-containing protein [Myxococcaceae bacterium]|nr:putative DNA-binding domain-containing protein [Myxococcaceae bacterium]